MVMLAFEMHVRMDALEPLAPVFLANNNVALRNFQLG